jgi:chromosome segregation ATPase
MEAEVAAELARAERDHKSHTVQLREELSAALDDIFPLQQKLRELQDDGGQEMLEASKAALRRAEAQREQITVQLRESEATAGEASAELEARLRAAQDELSASQNELNALPSDDDRKMMKTLREEIAAVQTTRKSLEEEKAGLEEKVQDMEADRALLVQECEDRNQEVERLREKLGETAEEEDGEDWELFDDNETF